MATVTIFELNSGYKVPGLGLGTYEPGEGDCYQSTKKALELGYRHIDTAMMYNNEDEVGRAIRDSGVPRGEIFLTTKCPPIHMRDPQKSLDESLKQLATGYVDLYLMHWPVPCVGSDGDWWGSGNVDEATNFKECWAKMEPLVAAGKAKSIGVSNFDTKDLDALLAVAKIPPAVNQVELHPYLPQHKLVEYCEKKNILLTAFYPLGASKVSVRDDPVVKEIAESKGVNPAQVLLAWGIQRGYSVIPKSANAERQAINLKQIQLSDEEMAKINDLGKKHFKRGCHPPFEGKPGVFMFQDDN